MTRSRDRNRPLEPIDALPEGRDLRSIGPSDSSDSGSDLAGTGLDGGGASDRYGTGERASAGADEEFQPDADIEPNRIVTATEAGLGGGLDQAEEAQFGVTDEELDIMRRQPHRIIRNPFR